MKEELGKCLAILETMRIWSGFSWVWHPKQAKDLYIILTKLKEEVTCEYAKQ